MSTASKPPPLLNAVQHFAHKHNLHGILDRPLTDSLAQVQLGDYYTMYALSRNILPKVPTTLQGQLYETMSDALVPPSVPIKHDGTVESATRFLLEVNERLQAVLAEGQAESTQTPALSQVTNFQEKPVPNQPKVDIVKPVSKLADKNAGAPKAKRKLHPGRIRRSSKLNQLDCPSCAPISLIAPPLPSPSLSSSSSSSSASTSSLPILDECGLFNVADRSFGVSYFTLPDGTTPPLNAHASALFQAGHLPRTELLPAFHDKTRTRWSKDDISNLKSAVQSHLASALNNRNLCAQEQGDVANQNETELEVMQKIVTKWAKQEWTSIVHMADIPFSWKVARSRFLRSDAPWIPKVNREQEQGPSEREIEGTPEGTPSSSTSSLPTSILNVPINIPDWTDDEDAALSNMTAINKILSDQQNGGWAAVAQYLRTKGNSSKPKPERSALETFRRWRFLQDESIRSIYRRPWTTREDNLLRKYVPVQKSWEKIAIMLGTLRSAQQCLHRYDKRLQKGRVCGRWGSDEVSRLLAAIKDVEAKTGGVIGNGQGDSTIASGWVDIAKLVGTRSDVQCREKWVGCLRPGLLRGGWTNEEDCKLKKAIQKASDLKQRSGLNAVTNSGYRNWRVIANFMNNGRDAVQCQRRASIMWSDEEIQRLIKAVTTQKPMDPSKANRLLGTTFLSQIPEFEQHQWNIIAAAVGTRSARQCRSQLRYLKS